VDAVVSREERGRVADVRSQTGARPSRMRSGSVRGSAKIYIYGAGIIAVAIFESVLSCPVVASNAVT